LTADILDRVSAQPLNAAGTDLTGMVLLRRDALAYGMDDRQLRRLVRGGELVRIRHGAYVDASTWNVASPELRHLLRASAVVRTANCDCALSHTSAAICLGADLWDLDLESVHLARFDHKSGRREAGVVQHCGLLTPSEVTTIGGFRCTNAVRTALDVTTIADVEHALVVVSSILHKKLASSVELRDGARAMTNVPGSLATELVLRLADERFDGPGETRTFHALWRQGIEAPIPQYPVTDASGKVVAFLDFAWPQYGVWLEFDGRVKYERLLQPGQSASDVVVREKAREDLVRRLTGWICVRITWSDLNDPRRIAAMVRRAILDQAHRVAN
jgi:hypothetical protein